MVRKKYFIIFQFIVIVALPTLTFNKMRSSDFLRLKLNDDCRCREGEVEPLRTDTSGEDDCIL